MHDIRVVIFGNLHLRRTEASLDLTRENGATETVAIVYETADGWETEVFDPGLAAVPGDGLTSALARAREVLSHYVNRRGENASDGLSVAGLAGWLMEKDDGTAMGRPVPT